MIVSPRLWKKMWYLMRLAFQELINQSVRPIRFIETLRDSFDETFWENISSLAERGEGGNSTVSVTRRTASPHETINILSTGFYYEQCWQGYFQKIGGKIDRFPQIVFRELNAIWNCDMKKAWSFLARRTLLYPLQHTRVVFTTRSDQLCFICHKNAT